MNWLKRRIMNVLTWAARTDSPPPVAEYVSTFASSEPDCLGGFSFTYRPASNGFVLTINAYSKKGVATYTRVGTSDSVLIDEIAAIVGEHVLSQ